MELTRHTGDPTPHTALGKMPTRENLLLAQSGGMPLVKLEELSLDKDEMVNFAAEQTLVLRSAAIGADMSMLAFLFEELHLALHDKSTPGTAAK